MLKKWLPLFLFLLPVVLSFVFVLRFGVNVPWGDQLDIVPPLLEKFYQGHFSVSVLTAAHNEHLIIFPRAIMLGLAWFTHWDTRVEMLLIQFMLVLILFILIGEMKRSGHTEFWWFVPLPWFIFNLKQWETMLFGVQIAYILPILMSLLALHSLSKLTDSKHPYRSFFGAVTAAVIASFSMMAGLLVWVAGAVVLILGWQKKRSHHWISVIWVFLGILVWSFYWSGLPAQSTSIQMSFAAANPIAILHFLASILGNALIARQTLAPFAGVCIMLLMVLVAILLFINRHWQRHRFWAGVVVFSLLALFSITFGRVGAGSAAAFAPRYTTFSLILLAGLYVLLANLVKENPTTLSRMVWMGLIIVFVLSLPIAIHRGWSFGILQKEKQYKQIYALRNAATLPDTELTIVHPVPQTVRRSAQILQRYGYSVFQHAPEHKEKNNQEN